MSFRKLVALAAVAVSAVAITTGSATAAPAAAAARTTAATAASARANDARANDARANDARANAAAARFGAGWLARELAAGHGSLAPFGAADISDTAYAVLGLHAAGVGRAPARQAVTFLQNHLGADLRNDDGTDNPGLLGYVVMAAVASGTDPYHFGGHGALNNLPHRLLATMRTSGPDAGLFGSADPTFDGAFRQGTALAALAAAHVKRGAVARALAWLTAQQCANGLWTSYRAVPAACAVADPTTFAGPDTNSTSMAVQGLAAYGRHPHRGTAIASLKAVRSSDGGFPYIAAPGQSSDPDSTALSIQTLLASGAKPGAAYAALSTFQLGCSDPAADRGAYFYRGDRSPNVLATVQAVPAAAGVTLPLRPSRLSSARPAPFCASRSGSGARPATESATARTATAPTALAPAAVHGASAARAGAAGGCKGTSGVTVTVDFKAFGGVEQTRCAKGAQTSGITALQHAGFTVAGTKQYGLAFVCRIQSLPSTAQQSCNSTPPANAYWSYYHAAAAATAWKYGTTGASSYKPPLGSIDAWAFGNSAKPTKTPAQVRASKS